MKYIFNLSIAVVLASLLFTACKKVENRTILSSNPTVPVLTVTPTTVIIDSNASEDDKVAATFNWTATDYGFQAATRYTLQIVPKGATWTSSAVKSIILDAAQTKSYSNIDLNNMMIAFGATPFVDTAVKVRVMSELVNTKIKPVYSNEIIVAVKNVYVDPVPPPAAKLYFPGDYQGWAPDNANCPYVESNTNDGKFMGFFEHTKSDGTNSNGEFKMTPAPNWDYDFGDAGTDYSNPLSGTGALGPKSNGTNGTNFKFANGTYYVVVDTAAKTWSYELRNWALTGSATTLGWPAGPDGTAGQDLNMRYNAASKMFEITTDLTAGAIKFRMNDAWTTNLGDNGNDGSLEGSGADIPVTDAGNYTIKLDVVNNTYTLTKN